MMRSREHRHIALVEDDAIMGESLLQRLTLEGYAATWWRTGEEALAGLHMIHPDLLICDIRLPDMSGEELFRAALPDLRTSPILFITAYGEIDQAVRLLRAGADDYLTKPFAMETFLGRVDQLVHRQPPPAVDAEPVLGVSRAMREVEALLRRVADLDSNLLLSGESGAGKEVAARFMHGISRRAAAPFMAVNCAAIPANLLESELFGHERGAFTGAHARHEGYAERARDGILFLDEVGELPAALQAKLLRLIEDRSFFRLGGERPVQCAARFVCASNADLDARVSAGLFRRDLYYRINVIPIHLSPLRERGDDIVPLLRRYVAEFAAATNADIRSLSAAAERLALAHSWPGNVRELRNRAERAVALAAGPLLGAHDLFPDLQAEAGEELPPLASIVEEAERRHIRAVLDRTGGQVRKTADLLGISRTTLWEKMRRLGLSVAEAERIGHG